MSWNWIFVLCIGVSVTGCDRSESRISALDSSPQAQKPSDRIARIHFVGSANAGQSTNIPFLTGVWELPETRELKSQTLNKLALAPFKIAKLRGIASTNDFAALFRPLLDDLVRAESWTELRGETNQTPDFALAVQLDAARADLWRTSLATILRDWTGLPVLETNVDGTPGWELKKHHAPNLIRFQQAGGWVILSAGEDKIALADELAANFKAGGRPCPAASNYVLSVEGDLTRVANLIPFPEDVQALQLSSVHAVWGISEDNISVHIVASRDAAFDFKPEPWRVPTNLIHQPLVGFTAVQGIGDLLATYFPRLKMSPMPEEYFVWTMQGVPLQSFIAAPVENASNALEQMAPQLLGMNTNPPATMAGKIEYSAKFSRVTWSGLLFLGPFIEGKHGSDGDFLFSGVFPNSPRGISLPEAMLNEVMGGTNLIYYSWEVTSDRMSGLRALSQFYLMFADYRQLSGTSVSGRWLDAVTSRLGNSVTEMFLTKPNELTLERKSPIGLTSFDLLMLANWLETPNFPFDKPIVPQRAGKGLRHRPANTAPPAMPGMP